MGYIPREPFFDNREGRMAADGNWNLVMSTPMGDRNATLNLKSSGGTLTGTQGAEGNSTEIFEGTVAGDDVAWKVSITNPMPLTLDFTGKVAGDAMSGEMGIGMMGSFPFTGKRAYAPGPPQTFGRHHRDCPGDPRLTFFCVGQRRGWPGHRRAEATPFFERLCP